MNELEKLTAKPSRSEHEWLNAELGSSHHITSTVDALMNNIGRFELSEHAACSRMLLNEIKNAFKLGFDRGVEASRAEAVGALNSALSVITRDLSEASKQASRNLNKVKANIP